MRIAPGGPSTRGYLFGRSFTVGPRGPRQALFGPGWTVQARSIRSDIYDVWIIEPTVVASKLFEAANECAASTRDAAV